MNLEYDLKKHSNYSILYFYIDEKKLTNLDFLCYMQFEYFNIFFVSVLIDLFKDKYKNFEFPIFSKETYDKVFALVFNDDYKKVNYNFSESKIYERHKYVNIIKNDDLLLFIPNKKKNINNLLEIMTFENKIFFQKILKHVFDKTYLILKETTKNCKIFFKEDFLIFFIQEI